VLTNIVIRVLRRAIDKEPQRRIILVVQSRNLNHRTRATVPITRNLNLRTLEVELGITTLCTVKGNVLNTDKILPGRGRVRNFELDLRFVPGAPVLVVEVAALRFAADDFLVDYWTVSLLCSTRMFMLLSQSYP
jgi:hypothetical protein